MVVLKRFLHRARIYVQSDVHIRRNNKVSVRSGMQILYFCIDVAEKERNDEGMNSYVPKQAHLDLIS